MALSLVGTDGNPWVASKDEDASGNNFITQRLKVVPSGNYTTGGDTLNLSTVVPPGAGPIPGTNTVLPISVTTTEQGTAATPSLSAAGGFYAIIQAAAPTLSNFLLKIFKNSAGSVAEYNNGAYGQDVLTDAIFLEVTWRKMA